MNRRDFLRSSVRAALAAVAIPAALASDLPRGERSGRTRAAAVPCPESPPSPEFVGFGSSYLKSADPLASSGGLRRDVEGLRQDRIHHRMPPVWRDRFHLGIRE